MTFHPACIYIHMRSAVRPGFRVERLPVGPADPCWTVKLCERDMELATVFLSPLQLKELAQKLVGAAEMDGYIVTRTAPTPLLSVTLDRAREWLENMGHTTEFIDRKLDELVR